MPNNLYYKHLALDWTYYPTPDNLILNETCLFEEEQVKLFGYNSRKYNDGYEADRNILINDKYVHSGRIIGCRPGFWCNKRFFCPSCSNHKGNLKYKAIAHIPVENFYHITIGHVNHFTFQSDVYIKSLFYKTIRNKLKTMKKEGLIDLWIASQEIYIRSLYPKLTINPHVHLLVKTTHVDDVMARFKKNKLNVHCQKIVTPTLKNVVEYFYKPVDMANQYSIDFPNNPYTVNRNIKRFLNEYSMFLIENRIQVFDDLSAFPASLPMPVATDASSNSIPDEIDDEAMRAA